MTKIIKPEWCSDCKFEEHKLKNMSMYGGDMKKPETWEIVGRDTFLMPKC